MKAQPRLTKLVVDIEAAFPPTAKRRTWWSRADGLPWTSDCARSPDSALRLPVVAICAVGPALSAGPTPSHPRRVDQRMRAGSLAKMLLRAPRAVAGTQEDAGRLLA